MQTILVTGGAGFIGSHTCLVLLENNFKVIILDSFVNGSKEALRRISKILINKKIELKNSLFIYEGDIRDEEKLNNIFEDFRKKNLPIEAVIHFARLKAVDDSFLRPNEYWNVV